MIVFWILFCIFSRSKKAKSDDEKTMWWEDHEVQNSSFSEVNEKISSWSEKVEEEVSDQSWTWNQEPSTEIIEPSWAWDSAEITKEENKEEPMKPRYAETMMRNSVYQVSHSATSKKRRKKVRYGQWIVFLVSLIVAVALFYIGYEFVGVRWYIISILIGFFFFMIIGKILDVAWFHNMRIITAWIYYLLILFFTLYSGAILFEKEELIQKIDQYVPISRLKEITFLQYDPTLKVNGLKIENFSLLAGEKGNLIQPQEILEPHSEDSTSVDTWNVVPSPSQWVEETPIIQNITFLEGIKYLLDTNQVPLSKKTSTNFDYMAKSDPNYAYFETAREKGLIGKNINPQGEISCDTYIVMKWLIEWWNVGSYSKNDIKWVYWEKASQLWKLNWCQKGVKVTNQML